jgi:hypothetical protein
LDADRTAQIGNILGKDYKLIVDVAMGEPANASELESSGVKKDKSKPEWYGFIRLMCWVNPNTAAGSILYNDDELVTCVIPTGSKKSQYYVDGEDVVEESSDYVKDAAPDKGSVAAYFPMAQLVITSTHLAGTNQYGVPEEVFDQIRIEQLSTIEKSLSYFVQRFGVTSPGVSGRNVSSAKLSETALIICGDLNFRVESKFISPEDKVKVLNMFTHIYIYIYIGFMAFFFLHTNTHNKYIYISFVARIKTKNQFTNQRLGWKGLPNN